jgi:hypothetical protein
MPNSTANASCRACAFTALPANFGAPPSNGEQTRRDPCVPRIRGHIAAASETHPAEPKQGRKHAVHAAAGVDAQPRVAGESQRRFVRTSVLEPILDLAQWTAPATGPGWIRTSVVQAARGSFL